MSFGQFLAAPELKLRIVTHRDTFQETAKMSSIFGEEYQHLSAVVRLDAKDIAKLVIKDGDTLILKNNWGKVIVKAMLSGYEEAHPGIAFMVDSPWCNALVPEDTNGTGVAAFKDFEVVASSAKGAKVTGIRDIE